MTRKTIILIVTSFFIIAGSVKTQANNVIWPNGSKLAVSLSYDDALNSQLDNAIPELNKHNLKASFYVLPNSPVMYKRMKEWVLAAKQGHELGNHSMYHPCRASLENRSWVLDHHDLDKYTLAQMVEEITTVNTFLHAIDGKTERTFTPPCGDLIAGGDDYLSKINEQFIAIKGQGIASGFSVLWAPAGVSGQQIINFIKQVPAETSLINILFHGVGGDHLAVSAEAHAELLSFLSNNSASYYVDSYINIMKYKHRLAQ